MQFIIPDIPAEVKTQMQREQMLAKEARYQHEFQRSQGQNEQNDSSSLYRDGIGSRHTTNPNMPTDQQNDLFGKRRSLSRRFSRLDDGLDAHIDVSVHPRQSLENAVWEVP